MTRTAVYLCRLLSMGLVACGETSSDAAQPTPDANAELTSTGGSSGKDMPAALAPTSTVSAPAGNPTLCGGAYSRTCGEGRYCRFDNGCGTVGHCSRIRDNCDDPADPVCGCDGKTYENACAAAAQGVSTQSDGECVPTTELLPCGDYLCNPGTYCIDKADANAVWEHICASLPEECNGTASCDCITQVAPCFGNSACAATAPSVTVTCR